MHGCWVLCGVPEEEELEEELEVGQHQAHPLVGPLLRQQPHQLRLPLSARHNQRRGAIVPPPLHIGPPFHQQPRNLHPALCRTLLWGNDP